MTNDELLQKLTLGIEKIVPFTVEVDGEKIDGEMRPLTSGELSKLQAMEKQGFVMKIGMNNAGKRQAVSSSTDVDVNAGDFSKYQMDAMYTAVAWSLSVPGCSYTKEDIENMEHGVPELLFNEVIRISSLTEEDLTSIKQFRK